MIARFGESGYAFVRTTRRARGAVFCTSAVRRRNRVRRQVPQHTQNRFHPQVA